MEASRVVGVQPLLLALALACYVSLAPNGQPGRGEQAQDSLSKLGSKTDR